MEIKREIITDWTATTLSHKIKSKEVSCVEVMAAYLSHIDKTNPKYNALVNLQEKDDLLSKAETKDQELTQGNYYGWMHGFPHAVKDLAPTKGITTTMGSPLLKNFVPNFDQLIVERIKADGAIIIGKTNIPEFGLGCQTYNSVYGVTANTYDNTKTSGGSSGGAAVGLATHMLPVADGSDMAGSLRNPASFNNVIGFRPTQGTIPYWPTKDVETFSLLTEGPMGRDVKDTAMLMSTMAGHDPRVLNSPKIDTSSFSQTLKKDFKNLKLGWLGDLNGYLPMEKGILDICEKALKQFKDGGVHIEATKPSISPQIGWESWLSLRSFQIGGILKPFYDDPQKRQSLKQEVIWEIENFLTLTSESIEKAYLKRNQWTQSINALFETYDFLLLPGSQVFPFDKETPWVKNIGGTDMETYHKWMEIYCLTTLTGCPILNIPVGFNDKGLPMGIQIIGKHNSDLDVFKIGYALEQLRLS